MKLLSIFGIGIIILFGALVVNIVANKIGLISWYDFIKNPGRTGIFSYLWLFIGYPFLLGVIGYLANLVLK